MSRIIRNHLTRQLKNEAGADAQRHDIKGAAEWLMKDGIEDLDDTNDDVVRNTLRLHERD